MIRVNLTPQEVVFIMEVIAIYLRLGFVQVPSLNRLAKKLEEAYERKE